MDVNGYFSDAIITVVLPVTIAGIINEINPKSGLSSELIKPTTPVGSKTVKL